MPIHDWSKVRAGLFHHFHQVWSVTTCAALNSSLPKGYYALIEQNAIGVEPDLLTLQSRAAPPLPSQHGDGGIAVAEAPPRTRFVSRAEEQVYATKANRISVRSAGDRLIAVIEIVSPGNKHSQVALRSFVNKAVDLLGQGVNLLVVDLFPPSVRQPQGIHALLWDELCGEPFEPPQDKRLTLAAYVAAAPVTAYVEPAAVGDVLPDMPVFLDPDRYVPAPLELAYENAWNQCPAEFRQLVLDASKA